MTLRLELGATTLDLSDPANGVFVQSWDLGYAVTRAVVENRTGASGTRDQTALHAGSVVTLQGKFLATAGLTRREILDSLRTFCRPADRPYLYIAEGAEAERRVLLRPDTGSAPFAHPPGKIDFAMSWVAPDGVLEAATESEVTVAATPDIEAGRTYDLTFPRQYPAGSPVGVETITNDGTADAWPVVTISGPCVGPQIENQTTGKQMLFPGLTLLSSETLELDMRERTALLGGGQSRLSFLDFGESEWWALIPGDNDIRYFPELDNGGSDAVVAYRSAWLP